jgi:hypothetical protein
VKSIGYPLIASALICLANSLAAEPEASAAKGTVAPVKLENVEYLHRFTNPNGDQFEYTPAGQEDLEKWTDMVTQVYYREANDGDKLAGVANSVLEIYKKNGADVVRTDSVPRTEARPAEHLVVVLFRRETFFEVSFARFQLREGVGSATIYGHRAYGADAAQSMGDWLKKNGAAMEKTLMSWDGAPKVPAATK